MATTKALELAQLGTNISVDVATGITVTGALAADTVTGVTLGGSMSGTADDAKLAYSVTPPSSPSQGYFYFDSLNQKLRVYTGSAWVDAVPSVGGGGGAGSSDALATFRKYTYSVTTTTNAVSGTEDDIVTTGAFVVGRLYEITTVGDTDFVTIGASADTVGQQFTATDVGDGTTGQAAEVLNYVVDGSQNIEVYVNGVKQAEGSSNDYVASTGSSVTFISDLVSGDIVDVQVYELLTTSSFYLKSEVNSQISTAVTNYLPLAGGNLAGSIDVDGTVTADGLVVDGDATVSGNVGIGTSSPTTTLDVNGSIRSGAVSVDGGTNRYM
jgi:hypothetical protein